MSDTSQNRRQAHLATPSLLLLGALLSLAGCTSTPLPPAGDAARPANPAIVAKSAAGSVPALPPAGSGRGGYYMDDGPGDVIPEDLLNTPDAVPQVEPYGNRGNRPYTVFGKLYTPITDDRPLKQRGIGSWYGKKFHGQKTSSGELYDMYKMTAAHPTLPLPSYVRVTNLKNGAQVIVRVNDRGPFLGNRIIDLSYTAALKLGYLANGSGELEVERLLPAEIERLASAAKQSGSDTVAVASASAVEVPIVEAVVQNIPPQPLQQQATVTPAGSNAVMPVAASSLPPVTGAPAVARGFYLQFGAYGQLTNAELARARLQQEMGAMVARLDAVEMGGLYRLMAGPYETRGAAQDVQQQIKRSSSQKPIIVER